jgi:hypothetical protein
MNTRKSLINAILSGNIEELKRMKKATNEPKIILLAFRNGKYLSLEGSKDRESQEYTPEEVEGLKKDHNVILLTLVEGRISSEVCTSEEEAIRRMEEEEKTGEK